MSSPHDFPASGKIIAARDQAVVFQPHNTTYELELKSSGANEAALNQRIECFIHVTARKVYTVPSGGNFIAPIFGSPRTIQGRIRRLDDRQMVVQAGTPIIVDLPADPAAVDLSNGPLAVGAMVNVAALPGARIEMKAQVASR